MADDIQGQLTRGASELDLMLLDCAEPEEIGPRK